MAARKGHKKAGGRKAGTPNRLTASVREALATAFDQAGGVPALVRFAKRSPAEFYKLWAKLLPTEATLTGTVRLQLVEEIIDGAPAKDDPPPPRPG